MTRGGVLCLIGKEGDLKALDEGGEDSQEKGGRGVGEVLGNGRKT